MIIERQSIRAILLELARTQETLTPNSLAKIVAAYMAQGPPCEPIDIEILVD